MLLNRTFYIADEDLWVETFYLKEFMLQLLNNLGILLDIYIKVGLEEVL